MFGFQNGKKGQEMEEACFLFAMFSSIKERKSHLNLGLNSIFQVLDTMNTLKQAYKDTDTVTDTCMYAGIHMNPLQVTRTHTHRTHCSPDTISRFQLSIVFLSFQLFLSITVTKVSPQTQWSPAAGGLTHCRAI